MGADENNFRIEHIRAREVCDPKHETLFSFRLQEKTLFELLSTALSQRIVNRVQSCDTTLLTTSLVSFPVAEHALTIRSTDGCNVNDEKFSENTLAYGEFRGEMTSGPEQNLQRFPRQIGSFSWWEYHTGVRFDGGAKV